MGNDKLKKPIPETINVNVIHRGKIFDVKTVIFYIFEVQKHQKIRKLYH